MPVADVGNGVGYLARADAAVIADAVRRTGDRARRFVGRGRSTDGGEVLSSSGGRRDAADRFVPATGGGDEVIRCLRGESMIRLLGWRCTLLPGRVMQTSGYPIDASTSRHHVGWCSKDNVGQRFAA
jgi:hypothetical protein